MTSHTSPPPLYREEQRFRSLWLWLLVLLVVALNWWIFLQQIVLGKPAGNRPGPDWLVWVIWLLFGVGLPIFFYRLALVVEVHDDAVHVRFAPLVNRRIPAEEIQDVEATTYRPVREYGGWGVRGVSRRNVAYNVSGNRGVRLTLRDGSRVLIGSQQPEALATAIAATKKVANSPGVGNLDG
ncbi:MAG: DUF6141 family protein [Caldilineales bacterium]|nr:DUF6141 family protein [Caldilineales bacterium]MDW8317226.1 DUF6141 family protein [Anaerolineae bacterium]